jgi:hypothetical protein
MVIKQMGLWNTYRSFIQQKIKNNYLLILNFNYHGNNSK